MTRFRTREYSIRFAQRVDLAAACAALVLLLSLASACAVGSEQVTVFDLLQPCTSEEGPMDALCGTIEVFEDRQAQTGREIALKVVVLPALSNDAAPDPLFILAGGPGMGAAENAAMFKRALDRIQINRDIVLVDQRGTGKSNPLPFQEMRSGE